MITSKKIYINSKAAWADLDWDDPVVPEALKKTDGQIARARGVRLNKDKISKGLKESYQQPGRLEKQQKAMQTRDNTVHKEAAKKRAADPKWQAKQKAAMEELRNDPVRWAEYQKNYNKGNKAKLDDPAFCRGSPFWRKTRCLNREGRCKRFTPPNKASCSHGSPVVLFNLFKHYKILTSPRATALF